MADADTIQRLNAALEGRYRIERQLGEGGMATVYLAEDVRHHRKVALKVLRPELAAVVGASRFLAEIETTANLQHPHILPLFDSGDADGLLFYVMPHVEGESLRARLDRERQLPIDEAVRIATNVAEALDYAHRHGVIHRDIKPANVLLLDGRPVIADFGIALAVSHAGGGRLTETGLSLGTPHYMSPEQATGDQSVGPATDIWALGCVLYEMLVGEPPYTGSTPQAVLGKIITSEPEPVTAERKSVPANVEAVIRKALEKVPADRFTGAQELARALADPGFRHGEAAVAVGGLGASRWKALSLLAVSTVALSIALVSILGRTDPPTPVTRLRMSGLEANHRPFGDFAIGPRSAGFVYEGDDDQFWYRRWEEPLPRPIRELGGPSSDRSFRQPWQFNGSHWLLPDGRNMSIVAGRELRLVSLDGGSVQTLADSVGSGANWGNDGYLYFDGLDGTIHRIGDGGGPVERLNIELGEGELRHHRFQVLPGGTKAVFAAFTEDGCRIWGVDLRTRERRFLVEGADPRVTPTGHLVFGDEGGRLTAAALDSDALELGPSVTLGPTIHRLNRCALSYWIASDGTFAYWESGAGLYEMVWVTRSGVSTPVDPGWLLSLGPGYQSWSLSPDNSKIAVMASTEPGVESDIWVKDLLTGSERRLTSWRGDDRFPTWRSDSTLIFVSTMQGGEEQQGDVFTVGVDGTDEPALLYDHPRNVVGAEPSRTSDWLVVLSGGDLLALRPDTDQEARPLLANPAYGEVGPRLSPDGRWLAYTSDQSGRGEVNVRPFPNVESGLIAVSRAGGMNAFWSPDGDELFYMTPGGTMMAAQLSLGPPFEVVSQQELFEISLDHVRVFSRTGWLLAEAARDGRFLMMRRTRGRAQFVLVHNWFEELKERVPG